jgi:hypothetical protein
MGLFLRLNLFSRLGFGRSVVSFSSSPRGSNWATGTLAEVNIISSTLDPEFNRNSGAIVDEALKSGTNQFHGDAFEFYRDTFLDNGNYKIKRYAELLSNHRSRKPINSPGGRSQTCAFVSR